MGKTYIDTVKYMIKSNFEIDGMVEKPDIVGAIFGQTEGLLGDELDLRELQKNGRIGRIEVDSQVRKGKSVGTILIPSSLDMVETSILAAALEIVDRVGPCDARINVSRIEDSRNVKRKAVLDRAKILLKTLLVEEIPESKELSEMVREDVKVADIVSYGKEALPAGPGIEKAEEIVVVEGRADVINLLKNNIKNVVAVGGANVGQTITDLCKQKEVTVFLDGDRGGDIILKELVNATDIDYVARAPPGKEVEELARKEIIQALRRRIPLDQVAGFEEAKRVDKGRRDAELMNQPPQQSPPQRFEEHRPTRPPFERREREPRFERPSAPMIQQPEGERMERVERVEVFKAPQPSEMSDEDKAKAEALKQNLKQLEGTLKARLLNSSLETEREVPIREIMQTLSDSPSTFALALDGIVTQRLIDLAEQKQVKFIAGLRTGNVSRTPPGLHVILAE
ncbi:MAG TPA: DNA primase DnaG [Candidatus Norongarragalinales archaeon]|nr:DNA primase DnaG [Candidatus Norongarragalinales archaeon]